MVKLIEFICSGNCGRSPVAELIARNYFEDNRIREYDSASSGNEVKYIEMVQEGKIPLPDFVARWGVDLGFQRGLFNGSQAVKLESILRKEERDYTPGENQFLLQIAGDTLYQFDLEEQQNRLTALEKFKIRGPFKLRPEQTIKGTNRVVILGMGPKNAEYVKTLYCTSDSQCPVIETLVGYSTGSPGSEIKDGFGRTQEEYLIMVEQMKNHVLRSVERMIA